MTDDQIDKEIMDYLDGNSTILSNKYALDQANELVYLLSELSQQPLRDVASSTDKKVYDFIKRKRTNPEKVFRIRNWFPHVAVAASLIILFYAFLYKGETQKDYQLLDSNFDKLSFIYDLNKRQLSKDEIVWLEEELKTNVHPNIKVTIVDLLNNYHSLLDGDFVKCLHKENTPSVQMAVLNTLENLNNIDFYGELLAFSKRSDLDITVKSKALELLSYH